MKRRIRTFCFGAAPVPLGRRADVLAAVKEHETLAWESAGRAWDAGCYLVRFGSRAELKEALRKQEQTRMVMEPPKLSPVVKEGAKP